MWGLKCVFCQKKKQLPNLLKYKNYVQKKSCLVKKRERERERERERDRQRERKELDELLVCKCKWAFSSIKQSHFLPSVFSPFWGENILVGPRRKNPDPTIYFPSSPPNQIHSKNFSFPFSLRNFPSTLFHLQTNTSLVFSFLIVVGVFKVDRWVLVSSISKVFDG